MEVNKYYIASSSCRPQLKWCTNHSQPSADSYFFSHYLFLFWDDALFLFSIQPSNSFLLLFPHLREVVVLLSSFFFSFRSNSISYAVKSVVGGIYRVRRWKKKKKTKEASERERTNEPMLILLLLLKPCAHTRTNARGKGSIPTREKKSWKTFKKSIKWSDAEPKGAQKSF